MKSSAILAASLSAMIGATGFLAVNAMAQQSAPPPRPAERAAPADPRRPAVSPEDRAAFFDARIAAVKAGLKLTPEQEKLWPAVESAVREGFAKREELRVKMTTQGRPADPVEGMRRMADAAIARGETMRKIVDAAQPLYASLGEDQKRRLTMLMHGPRDRMARMGERMRGMWNGERRGPGMTGPREDRRGPTRGQRDDGPRSRGDDSRR